jgi:hypothetical protein
MWGEAGRLMRLAMRGDFPPARSGCVKSGLLPRDTA